MYDGADSSTPFIFWISTWFEILSIMLNPGTECTYPNACSSQASVQSLDNDPSGGLVCKAARLLNHST